MSFVEVFPVEPVTATTFAPAGSQLAPPGARKRLQARERIGVHEHRPDPAQPKPLRGPARRAQAPPAPPTRPHSMPAPHTRPRPALSAQADEQLAPPHRAGVDHRTTEARLAPHRGTGSAHQPSTSCSAQYARASHPLMRSLRPSRRCPYGHAGLPGDTHIVERQLAAIRKLLALLMALARDHQHVSRRWRPRSPADRLLAVSDRLDRSHARQLGGRARSPRGSQR